MNATQAADSPSGAAELGPLRSPTQRYALYALLLLVIVLFALVRARLRNVPLERDEGEYAYSGQLMLQGIPPYQLAYNMKLPGTYAAYAAIMAVFGQTPAGIHLGVLLVNSATTFLLFLLAKYLHGPLTGVVAGATYALLSTSISVLGFDGHATHFVTLAAVAGFLFLLRSIDSGSHWLLLCSGLCLGVAFLMKQHGIVFAIFAGLYLLWTLRESQAGGVALRAFIFSAGVAFPFGLACLILWRAGVFHPFWFWTFSYGRAYATLVSLREGVGFFRSALPWIVRPVVIWAIAGVGLTTLRWSKAVRTHAVFTVGFLFFSFLAVCPGLYFRPHYFIVMLPAVALWTGIGVAAPAGRLMKNLSQRRFAWIPVIVFVLVFALSIYQQRSVLFQWDPLEVYRSLHQGHGCSDGCAEAVEVAGYIQANSQPDARIAVLGSEPEIYFYSHRHSATGYIYMFSLTEKQKFAGRMQLEMMAELERTRPEFVVYVDDAFSWWNTGSTRDPQFLRQVQQWILGEYRLEKHIPVPGDAPHLWGDQPGFYIFRRQA